MSLEEEKKGEMLLDEEQEEIKTEEPSTGEPEKPAEAEKQEPTEVEKLTLDLEKAKGINKKLEAKNRKNYDELKELKKENMPEVEVKLTKEEEELKFEDPDTYAKLYAKKHQEAVNKVLQEEEKAETEAGVQEQLATAFTDFSEDESEEKLKDFNKVMFNDNGLLKMDHVPPIKRKEWEDQGLSIKEQVKAMYEFLTGTKVENPETLEQPSLGDMGGSATPPEGSHSKGNSYNELE